MDIHLVYFINVHMNPRTYHHLFLSQMKDVLDCKLLEHATLHIEACVPISKLEEITTHVHNAFPQYLQNKVILTCHEDNSHEFRGLDRVWRLGQEHPSATTMIGYFHSKGITYIEYSETNNRESEGARLFELVIHPWKEVEIIFESMSHINKIGATFSTMGWMWINFWWARGSYINWVEKPILTNRRHYYEDWLCRRVYTMDERFHKSDREELSYNDPTIYNVSDKDCYNIARRDHQIADTTDTIDYKGLGRII